MVLLKNDSPVARLYDTQRWRRTRSMVVERAGGRCERCGKMITGRFIVHHKTPATFENFYNPDILQLLCIECHNTVTFVENVKRKESEIYSIDTEPVKDLIDFSK